MTDRNFGLKMAGTICGVAACLGAIVALAIYFGKDPTARLDCSGCPVTADACMCVEFEPEPPLAERRGWFPCILSNGVEAQCLVGGSTETIPAPQQIDFQPAAADGMRIQYGWNLMRGGFGLGIGENGLNYVPIGEPLFGGDE